MKTSGITPLIFCILSTFYAGAREYEAPLFDAKELTALLSEYLMEKDARIGVAVISDDGSSVNINGSDSFPMLSVFKFPQALAVSEFCTENGISFCDSINVGSEEILLTTYSPMREKYGVRDLRLLIAELLAYAIQKSDNNACDILFRFIGGPEVADKYLKNIGFRNIHILSTEADMHGDSELCYLNSATPIEMAELLRYFDTFLRKENMEFGYIAELMETCSTGTDRLGKHLTPDDGILGHKTGTGDKNSDGRLIAINDVGYIHLKNGRNLYIAVFISDSAYDFADISAIIAHISRIILSECSR